MNSDKNYRPRTKCPHCGHAAKIRTSRDMSETAREQYAQCTNVFCGHTWVLLTSAVRTIAPSMCPNPKVYIPLSPRAAAAQPAADSQGALDLGEFNPRAMAS